MENKSRVLEWKEFVNSHTEHCNAQKETSMLSIDEFEELFELIRSGQAEKEQILKFVNFSIYNDESVYRYHVFRKIPMKTIYDLVWKFIPLLDEHTRNDYLNSVGIGILEGDCDEYEEEFFNSDFGQEFLEKWSDIDGIFEHLSSDGLEYLARNGYQQAYDILYNEGYGVMDTWDYDNFLKFIIKCEDSGVNIGTCAEWIEEELDYGYNKLINNLATLGAYRYLDRNDLSTYEWVKNHLNGNDIVAEIAVNNINKVIQCKDDIKWLKSEADKKVPQAQYLMGILNLGVGGILEKNNTLALSFFRASDSNGCELAKEYILKIEEELVKEAEEEKQRKQAEFEAAASAKILIQKAENGELSSDELFELAAVLSYGDASKGIKKNLKKATKFYRMAAEKGSAKAQYQLGIHLIEGIGCHKNWNAGIKWLKKSAEQNYDPADTYLSQQNTFLNRLLHKFIK